MLPAKKSVLVVEDTADIANLMTLALEMLGLEVLHASSAPKALELLENKRPDLIVTDIGLPGMSGWQFLASIKERCTAEQIAVIVTTAFNDAEEHIADELQNMAIHLGKPFQISELQRVVKEALKIA